MGIKVIAKNKRAHFDYILSDRFEAGLALVGTEVKTLRLGKVSLGEAYVKIDDSMEAWILNMKIPQYEFGNRYNHEEARKRKLLLHRSEIQKMHHLMMTQRMTVVPTMIYFKGQNVKIEISLAKGKKLHDKRQSEAQRDFDKKTKQGVYE